MRNNILGLLLIASFAIYGWNYQQSQENIQLSDLALDNIEALASGEGIDQYGYKLVNDCCKAYQPREFVCNSVWPDCK